MNNSTKCSATIQTQTSSGFLLDRGETISIVKASLFLTLMHKKNAAYQKFSQFLFSSTISHVTALIWHQTCNYLTTRVTEKAGALWNAECAAATVCELMHLCQNLQKIFGTWFQSQGRRVSLE